MLIALLTDFGTRDYFVAAMKGVILSIDESAKIIDISHEIKPQNIQSASFTLRSCYEDFPPKTIFAAVVDPGVGSERRAILVETADYYFIAPDNGLLSFVFNSHETGENANGGKSFKKSVRVFELTDSRFFKYNLSNTFHGRDIFAPVAAHLASGVNPEEFGREITDYQILSESKPHKISASNIEAEIIHADRFGNLITNLKRADLPAKFSIRIGETRIEKLCVFFAEAEPDEIFMIFGSAGFLEIAARNNSAARILKISEGAAISVNIEL